VVPLVVVEEETDHCRKLLTEDAEVVVWFFTPVEVISALTRRRREGSLKLSDFRKAKEQLALLERAWSEVVLLERVRERARRLLESHPLRAADALQLAAAILAAEENPQDVPFVTLDRRLASAAEKEGFLVLGAQG
jgi:predicted nucleic acid-binding protein